MKKKILKLLALLTALILIFGLGWTANSMVGNPVSKYLAKKGAEKYLSEKYPGTDYYSDETRYNFKDGTYHTEVKSPSSIDTHFTLSMDMAGKLCWDSFGQVEDKSTTAFRLDGEYRDLAGRILESPSFPYKSDIMYGTLEIHPREDIYAAHGSDGINHPAGLDIPAYSLVQEDLDLDSLYDIRQLGAQAGRLVIYMESGTATVEAASKTIWDIKQSMDHAGVPFQAMEFHLQEPLPEDGSQRKEGIDVLNILYKDIQEDHLDDLVERADKEAKAYYAALDKGLGSEEKE